VILTKTEVDSREAQHAADAQWAERQRRLRAAEDAEQQERDRRLRQDCEERQATAAAEHDEHLRRSAAIERGVAEFSSRCVELDQRVRRAFSDMRRLYADLLDNIIDGGEPDLLSLASLAAVLGKDEGAVLLDAEESLARHLTRNPPAECDGIGIDYVAQLRTRRASAKEQSDEMALSRLAGVHALPLVPDEVVRAALSPPTPVGPPIVDIGRPPCLPTGRPSAVRPGETIVGVNILG
jgi:hypothetical protein